MLSLGSVRTELNCRCPADIEELLGGMEGGNAPIITGCKIMKHVLCPGHSMIAKRIQRLIRRCYTFKKYLFWYDRWMYK